MTWSRKFRHIGYRCLLAVGIEAHPRREELRFLPPINIKTVLDIGANEGQYARRLRKLLPNARIYSFEPLPVPFQELTKLKARDPNFEAVNLGLSDETREVDFEINDFSPSSSMLAITKKQVEAFPETARTRKTRVSLTTLDKWACERELETPLLLKMDVQGLEDRVIRGGLKTISRAEVIISEVSFSRLYEGQPLFDDIYRQLHSLNFRCAGMVEPLYHPQTGEILQADAIFIRSTSD